MNTAMPTDPIYFDISDIIRHAQAHHRVSGIQRVQLRLIGQLVAKHGARCIRGIAFVNASAGWREIDLSFLIDAIEFEPDQMLLACGIQSPGGRPHKSDIKKMLKAHEHNKLLRAARKVSLYTQMFLMPERMEQLGFKVYRWKCKHPISFKPIADIPTQCTYAILGSNWSIPETEARARSHRARGGQVAQMVYDLIPITHTQFHHQGLIDDFSQWLRRAHEYSTQFLCISQNTATDLRNFLGHDAHQIDIRVTALPHEFAGYARNSQALSKRPDIAALMGQDFVLCVGTLEIRKNGVGLLKAWKIVTETLGDQAPTLVFAGGRGWKLEAFDQLLAATGHLNGKVQIIDSPSDQDLVALYSHCLFTIYPSLYEGWGLPVGEGAWFGKYGVVSATSSLPEVCGDLMDYVDPENPQDIAQKALRPIQDRAYLARRHEQVRSAPLRTWRDTADQVFESLRSKMT
ncbi:MAG TPA: glycosyltransferase family 1 protein [Aquabacterium sp.]|nr:glycosyltransferase family 1 protein [Aquabacterium sp.]HRH29935.1 glycosyltransferase family 1 protein [Aquabacterium sp.]